MTASGCRDLRVEYLRAPIGIGVRVPRFSWIVDHAQDAYELEVHASRGATWASGAVESRETSLIDYAGAPLASNTAYSWRVRSRDADGWSDWTESTFETALLDASDWVAAWVEPDQQDAVIERWSIVDWIRGLGPDTPPEERLRPPQLLRQSFDVRAGAHAGPPLRDGARLVLRLRQRRARRRPGARAGIGRLRAPHLGAVLRRDCGARRGRERPRRRARRRLVDGPPRPHRLERAVRHPHLGDLAAAPRLCRRHDRGRGIRSRRPQRDRPVDVCRPLRR